MQRIWCWFSVKFSTKCSTRFTRTGLQGAKFYAKLYKILLNMHNKGVMNSTRNPQHTISSGGTEVSRMFFYGGHAVIVFIITHDSFSKNIKIPGFISCQSLPRSPALLRPACLSCSQLDMLITIIIIIKISFNPPRTG